MRCQRCGKQLDARARFCTNCDYDNYPEMNRVKTKNNVANTQSATYRQTSAVNTANTSTQKSQQKKPKTGALFFIIVVIYLLLAFFGGLFE